MVWARGAEVYTGTVAPLMPPGPPAVGQMQSSASHRTQELRGIVIMLVQHWYTTFCIDRKMQSRLLAAQLSCISFLNCLTTLHM